MSRNDPRKPSRAQRRAAERQGRKSPGPAGSRADLWIALGLTLLAWLHRLAFLRSNRDWDWPYTIFYEGDSETFYRYARSLLAGQLYDNGIPFHPPGFAWVLSVVHTLVGAGDPYDKVPYFAVKAAVALIGSASIGLLYAVARPYLGRAVALVAALLSLYSFGLYVLHVAPVTEGTYQTLLLLCLLLWTRRFEPPLAAPLEPPRRAGVGGALLLGLMLGLLALVRAEGVLAGLILGGVGLVGWWKRRAGLRPWALVLVGWVALVAPWTVRNAIRLADFNARQGGAEPLPTFVPITIYGPINLALANNPQADGTFSRASLSSASQSGVLDLRDPQHLRFFLHGDEMAWGWIRGNPGAFGRLLLRKWALFFGAWRLGWTQWDWPGGLDGVRWPVDVFVPDYGIGLWIGPPLAFLGLVLCLGTAGGPRRWAVLVLLLTCVGLLATGFFFGYARQGLLYLPFWNTLVAAALVALVRRLARWSEGWSLPPREEPLSPRLLKAIGGAALVLLLLEAWGATADRNYRATGTNVAGETYLNRDDPMRLEVLPAKPE